MPSAAALNWYQSGDPAVLVQAIHCDVRFVGEAMAALASGPRTHEQLLALASEEFDLRWDTTAPVRDRTSWLAVTGMVELFDRQIHLTEAGRSVLATIAPGRPDSDGTDTAVQLPPTAKAVAHLIEQLDEDALRERADGANLYVPGTSANGGTLDALQVLTEAAIHSITDAEFVRFVQGTFPKAQSVATARTAKDTLKALGLIQRTSSESWAVTAGCPCLGRVGRTAGPCAHGSCSDWLLRRGAGRAGQAGAAHDRRACGTQRALPPQSWKATAPERGQYPPELAGGLWPRHPALADRLPYNGSRSSVQGVAALLPRGRHHISHASRRRRREPARRQSF